MRARRGWGPQDITAEQRLRAWTFFQDGKDELTIRNNCHLSGAQYDWLVNVGDSDRPSFMSLYDEQLATIRTGAFQLAHVISDRGLEVVKLQLENAILAEKGKQRILKQHLEHEEFDMPGPLVIPPEEIATLKVLNEIGNKMAQVGTAYRQIYGGELRVKLADEASKKTGQHTVSADFMQDLNDWSAEQMAEFARSGKEPKRSALPAVSEKEILEAEIVPDIRTTEMSPENQALRKDVERSNALAPKYRKKYIDNFKGKESVAEKEARRKREREEEEAAKAERKRSKGRRSELP